MQLFCWGPLRVRWSDRMLQVDFLRPDAIPIRLEQTLFLLMKYRKIGQIKIRTQVTTSVGRTNRSVRW